MARSVKTLVRDPDMHLIVGDAVDVLKQFDHGCFDAIVTSPPYLDVRDDITSYSMLLYADWAARWLDELHRVLSPTGSLMLNMGRVHRDGVEIGWHEDVKERAGNVGFKWLDTICWHKVNGGGGRSSPYLVDRHEYVYWLSKTTDPYRGYDEARQPYSSATLARYTRRWTARGGAVKGVVDTERDGRAAHPDGAKPSSVYVCSVGAEKGIAHPTPMAPELATYLIQLSCPPGGLILDPFAGAGTTARQARMLGRRTVLIELHERHAQEAAERLSQQSLLA